MKNSILYILLIFTLLSCKQNKVKVPTNFKSTQISTYISPYELDSINENWVKEDSLFLSELKTILRNDERNIIEIFKIDENDKRTKLGFGYEQIESNMGKGYISIFYNLIFKNGKVQSYEFRPQLPRNKLLTKRYKKFYSGIFKIENNIIYNRYYNIEEMENPLKNLNSDSSLNENLRFLMTPFLGTRYGFVGGYSGSMLTNRAIFLEESENITPDLCRILMNSINPSTRLMAIEYFMTNKSDFKNIDLINNWIDKVYSELPTIETLEGCFVMQKNSKQLVLEYVKRKN